MISSFDSHAPNIGYCKNKYGLRYMGDLFFPSNLLFSLLSLGGFLYPSPCNYDPYP